MEWQKKIPGCFGINDAKFAVHQLDNDRAKKAIAEAKAAGASRDDFEKELVWHLYKEVTDAESLGPHIKEQVKTLHKLWKV